MSSCVANSLARGGENCPITPSTRPFRVGPGARSKDPRPARSMRVAAPHRHTTRGRQVGGGQAGDVTAVNVKSTWTRPPATSLGPSPRSHTPGGGLVGTPSIAWVRVPNPRIWRKRERGGGVSESGPPRETTTRPSDPRLGVERECPYKSSKKAPASAFPPPPPSVFNHRHGRTSRCLCGELACPQWHELLFRLGTPREQGAKTSCHQGHRGAPATAAAAAAKAAAAAAKAAAATRPRLGTPVWLANTQLRGLRLAGGREANRMRVVKFLHC